MNRKRWGVLLCILILLGFGTAVFAAGGGEDPLLSVSYLYDTFLPKLRTLFSGEAASAFQGLSEEYGRRLDALENSEDSPWSHASGYRALEMQDGGSVSLASFSRFLMSEGSAMLHVLEGEVLDLTDGRVCREGEMLQAGHRYFAAEESELLIRSYATGTVGFADGDYILRASGSFSPGELFLDISTHWGRDRILTMVETGLVNGMEPHRFEPDRRVTRSMFVTILGRYCGASAETAFEDLFPDVGETDWFAPYVVWAAGEGLVQGYDDGTFGPGLEITREQMALLLVRFCEARLPGLPEIAEDRPFTDEEEISSWASAGVHQARRWGLVSGRDDGSFDPKGTATRAEMCAIICNLMDRTAAEASAPAESPAAEAGGQATAPEEENLPETGGGLPQDENPLP